MGRKILTSPLLRWYDANKRDLPWRHTTNPWAILVSEVMSQQTPVSRVAPVWVTWMRRWPTAADLAAASPAEVLRAWGHLGYPRRALRLQSAAAACIDGVPTTYEGLVALPGVGDYTARAVLIFAYGQPIPVVDINVRRVLYRLVDAQFLTPPARASDIARIKSLSLATATPAMMELGALICTATNPHCASCPLKDQCAWVAAGSPPPSAEALAGRTVQKFTGTNRQVRGKIMALLRSATEPVPASTVDTVWPDRDMLTVALDQLIEDGLVEQLPDGRVQLPSSPGR